MKFETYLNEGTNTTKLAYDTIKNIEKHKLDFPLSAIMREVSDLAVEDPKFNKKIMKESMMNYVEDLIDGILKYWQK